jgi:excisionase family DNA binding protein
VRDRCENGGRMDGTVTGKSLLRVDEVAHIFGVSKWAVYRRIDEGKLAALRVGRLLRIRRTVMLAGVSEAGRRDNMSSEKSVDEAVDKNARETEKNGELTPSQIETLKSLISAAQARRYVDWLVFGGKAPVENR